MRYLRDLARENHRATASIRRARGALGALLLATASCHSSFQPFPDALACAGASVRTVGLDADSAGITHLSNLNDVVWYGWKNGTKRYYVTYHGASTGDSLPADGTPKGINSAGVVVASSATGPILFDHGAVTRIVVPASWTVSTPTPYSGTSTWTPFGINDSGVVAMGALATPIRELALYWKNGTASSGIAWTAASTRMAINNANVVLTNRAATGIGSGTLYELHAPDGTIRIFDAKYSFAANDLGDVAYSTLAGGSITGTLQPAVGSPQSLSFAPTGLNNNLQMIGTGTDAERYAVGSKSVRLDHALDNLNLTITKAVAINNNGTIAANAMNLTVNHQVGLLFNASACTLK
jgi:hypothetical protein